MSGSGCPAPARVIEAVRNGSQQEFGALIEPHRGELRVHCYRILGSFDDAEDMVQEAFLQAWRRRDTFEGRAPLRAWLYRIATNSCLQLLRRTPRPTPSMPTDGRPPVYSLMPWLQPIPDTVLDQAAPTEQQPDARAVTKETVTLAFLAVIQLLPPRQRAVLLLRDVLAFTTAETAAVLDSSPAAVNSALQRARTTLAQFRPNQQTRTQPADEAEKTLLDRYITAHERLDPQAIIAVLRDDARLTICPTGLSWDGREEITKPYLEGMGALGEWRCLGIRANRQPAVAHYLRRWGSTQYEAFTVVVLDVRGDQLTELATFAEPSLFAAFGLPAVLP